MKERLILFIVIVTVQIGNSQPNCMAIKDSTCIKACEIANEAAKYQGAKYSQELFDQAIALCPSFAYAHYEKSVPYLKQGLLKEWKEQIDRAVALEPKTYLLNRGCNQIQFFRNYEYGLKDLNKLYELKGYFDIGYNNSGDYHAQMLRAICYQKLGDILKYYDYFHIGIAYLEADQVDKAKRAFDTQNKEIELAETYYYYSKLYQKQNNSKEATKCLEIAQRLYKEEKTMSNNYYHYIDKVFYTDIEKELSKLKK